MDAIDPAALVAAHETFADVVGDAATGHVVIQSKGVEAVAVLFKQLVQGGREVRAGRVVGVHPQRPGLRGEVKRLLPRGPEVVHMRPVVAGIVGIDAVNRAVLLADLGDLEALGLGPGGVHYDHFANGGSELSQTTVKPFGFVADNHTKRDLLAWASFLHLAGRWVVNKRKPPALAGGSCCGCGEMETKLREPVSLRR